MPILECSHSARSTISRRVGTISADSVDGFSVEDDRAMFACPSTESTASERTPMQWHGGINFVPLHARFGHAVLFAADYRRLLFGISKTLSRRGLRCSGTAVLILCHCMPASGTQWSSPRIIEDCCLGYRRHCVGEDSDAVALFCNVRQFRS